MDKQLFDGAMGEVPPSTVDVDAVITRERRAAWVRRVASPGVAAAAGVVAVTFGVAITLSGSSDPIGAGNPPSITPPPRPTSSTPGAVLPPCQAPDPATAPAPPRGTEAAAARLTDVLKAAVQAQIPQDMRLQAGAGNTYQGQEHGPLEFFHIYQAATADTSLNCSTPMTDHLVAGADTVDQAGTGGIHIIVGRLGLFGPSACEPQNPGVTCDWQTGPNGEEVLLQTGVYDGSITNGVTVVKPDGTTISLASNNGGLTPVKPLKVERAEPPLTLDQLKTIVLDPGLTLYPR